MFLFFLMSIYLYAWISLSLSLFGMLGFLFDLIIFSKMLLSLRCFASVCVCVFQEVMFFYTYFLFPFICSYTHTFHRYLIHCNMFLLVCFIYIFINTINNTRVKRTLFAVVPMSFVVVLVVLVFFLLLLLLS